MASTLPAGPSTPADRPPAKTAGKPGVPKPSPATRAERKENAPKRGRPPGTGKSPLKDRLEEQFTMIGVLVCAANEVDGLAIVDGAERLAESLDKLARQKPAVRRALDRALSVGVYGEVTAALMAVALPIALNHSMLPDALAARVGIVYRVPGNGSQVPAPGLADDPAAAAEPLRPDGPSPY